eukprot:2542395-Rhodomonas_salina.3
MGTCELQVTLMAVLTSNRHLSSKDLQPGQLQPEMKPSDGQDSTLLEAHRVLIPVVRPACSSVFVADMVCGAVTGVPCPEDSRSHAGGLSNLPPPLKSIPTNRVACVLILGCV